ncbi:GATOR2 complex protein WDR59-like isoform X2 [Artemia franciscana]|uniref:RWD domain-containing protein n=1 Tax=Artemia franciscana TaxID=6661 RepID=A0AA88LC39_ARTSF|nr:hypothetical protein QYM36_001411 [Artemia franciscana]
MTQRANSWSSETSSTYFKDLQATVLALGCTGEYLLLGGRRYLAVLGISGSPQVLKKVSRQSKYELTAAEWNPHLSHSHLSAIACNQKPEIYAWEEGRLELKFTLKQHTRTVTGLSWHRFDPTLLATCSVDAFVHVWDIREPRKPSLSVQSIVGTSQVQWNKCQGNIFATTQDNVIQVWDQRSPAMPVQYITAHLSKIYCLDWSASSENHVMTASMDASAKIFNINNPRQYEKMIETGAPVWKARYTPFSDSMVTLSIHQMKRGETKMDLWSVSDLKQPVHSFIGLNDSVYDFAVGKIPGKGMRDHQIICLCKDQTLKTWVIDNQVKAACGYENTDIEAADGEADTYQPIESLCNPVALEAEVNTVTIQPEGVPVQKDVELAPEAENFKSNLVISCSAPAQVSHSFTPSFVRSRMSEKDLGSPGSLQPKTLLQEFALVNESIDENLFIEELDAENRICRVRASSSSGKRQVVIQVQFPVAYPYSPPPSFQFCQGSTEDPTLKSRILKGLKETAQQKMKRNLSCLEPCLRQLVTILEELNNERPQSDTSKIRPSLTLEDLDNVSAGRRDMSVPYPRSSGARFCSAGMLVCFGRPSYSKRVPTNGPTELKTPRSLSTKKDLLSNRASSIESQYGLKYPLQQIGQSPTGEPSTSLSYHYYLDRRSRGRTKARISQDEKKITDENKKKVTIYDASGLMPLNKDLARKYRLDDKNISECCRQNAEAAAQLGRRDLVHVWNVAATITSPLLAPSDNIDAGTPWAQHPGGRKLAESLISHYVKINDVQTAAMLSCVFGSKTESLLSRKMKNLSASNNSNVGESAYHTIHPSDTSLEGWNYGIIKHSRSNSWSESFDEIKSSPPGNAVSPLKEEHERNCKLLDPAKASVYDSIRWAYAEILYRWEMPDERAVVLKFQSIPSGNHMGIDFFVECNVCRDFVKESCCRRCRKIALQCALCHVGVRGSSTFCLVCGHGGHTKHIMEWFKSFESCATGCGCKCKIVSPIVV